MNMDFESLSIEMKRTMLEAAVGRVSIAAHSFELKTKILFCLEKSGGADELFIKEYNSFNQLKNMLNYFEGKGLFKKQEIESLHSTRMKRNEFTHALSESYISAIVEKKPIIELIFEFEELKNTLNESELLLDRVLYSRVSQGGLNIIEMQQAAEATIDAWEEA